MKKEEVNTEETQQEVNTEETQQEENVQTPQAPKKTSRKMKITALILVAVLLALISVPFIVEDNVTKDQVKEAIEEVLGCPYEGSYVLEVDDIIVDFSITNDYKVYGNIDRVSISGEISENRLIAQNSEWKLSLALTDLGKRIRIAGTLAHLQPTMWEQTVGSPIYQIDVSLIWQ